MATTSPFWNVGQYLSSDGTDWGESTDWGKSILEQNPDIAYYRYGRQMGVPDDNSAFSKWFQNQYPQFNKGYGAYVASSPATANIVDYIKSLGGIDTFQKQFQSLAPQLRGLDPGDRGAGPSRWISR